MKNQVFLEIRKLVNKIDPDGLAPGEMTPEDEYNWEVESIIELVRTTPDMVELENKLSGYIFGKNQVQISEANKTIIKFVASLRDEVLKYFDDDWSKNYQEKKKTLQEKAESFNKDLGKSS